jgi:hypothetical protein
MGKEWGVGKQWGVEEGVGCGKRVGCVCVDCLFLLLIKRFK